MTNTLRTLVKTARSGRSTRRDDVAARRRLAAELAAFSSEADRNDLNALLDTYPDTQVAEIRDLLNQRVAA